MLITSKVFMEYCWDQLFGSDASTLSILVANFLIADIDGEKGVLEERGDRSAFKHGGGGSFPIWV